MALTELQLPDKTDFYNNLRAVAANLLRLMVKLELVYEFIDDVGTADLDSMGVPAGLVRTDLQDFRNLLAEYVALWNNNPVTPAKDPQEVIDKIRNMNII